MDHSRPHRGAAGMRITVAGAGPAGSAAALLLARCGAEVTIIERVAEPAAVGAGILLQPNGLAVLYALGLREALLEGSHRSTTGSLRDAQGHPLIDTAVPDFGDGFDHMLTTRRSHLASVLAAAVADHPAIEARYDAPVIGASPAGTLSYREHGSDHEITGDLVIGADGVHSVVRAAGDFGSRVSRTGHRYIRAIVPAESVPAAEYWTALGLFGTSPLDEATAYFYADATARPVRTAVTAGDVAAVRSAWAPVLPAAAPLLAAVASFDRLLVNEVERVDCDRFVAGRLVLIGDAAHAMAPTLGQGANSALVDAAVLALALHDTGDVSVACARFDSQRRVAVRRVQRDADRIARISSLRSSPARRTRDAFIRRTSRPRANLRRYRAVQQVDPAALHRSLAAVTAGA